MPAVVPFIPLIVGGITGGTMLTAAKMQSNANRSAAQMQSDALTNAQRGQDETQRRAEAAAQEQQAHERQQEAYNAALLAQKEQARAPYVDLSNRSMTKMADLLGMPGWSPMPPDRPGFGGNGMPPTLPQQRQRAPALDNPMNFSGAQPSASALPAETVVIMAPTGETRRVPKTLAQQYVSMGGRVMQGT